MNKPILCGLDEAGRGALAGPLVAAAVILPKNISISVLSKLANTPIRDGKKLSKTQRSKIFKTLITIPNILIKTHTISVSKINLHGIGWANKEIFRKLIKNVAADNYIIDGNLNIGLPTSGSLKIQSIPKADTNILEVMLAGIAAKVARDRIMQILHQTYPIYKWEKNVGYGTKYHIDMLIYHGNTIHHRSKFINTALSHRNK